MQTSVPIAGDDPGERFNEHPPFPPGVRPEPVIRAGGVQAGIF